LTIFGRRPAKRAAQQKSVQFPTIEENQMNRLLIALIAGTFAATVGAQGTATTPTKEKQKTVDAVTKAGADGADIKAQEAKGVADAKAAKGTAKALPTTKDKQKAVDATTKASTDAAAADAQEKAGVAAAKASKDTPKALPTTKDKQKAVDATTKAGASQ
jgi:hypothetical protein